MFWSEGMFTIMSFLTIKCIMNLACGFVAGDTVIRTADKKKPLFLLLFGKPMFSNKAHSIISSTFSYNNP